MLRRLFCWVVGHQWLPVRGRAHRCLRCRALLGADGVVLW